MELKKMSMQKHGKRRKMRASAQQNEKHAKAWQKEIKAPYPLQIHQKLQGRKSREGDNIAPPLLLQQSNRKNDKVHSLVQSLA